MTARVRSCADSPSLPAHGCPEICTGNKTERGCADSSTAWDTKFPGAKNQAANNRRRAPDDPARPVDLAGFELRQGDSLAATFENSCCRHADFYILDRSSDNVAAESG